MRRSERGGRLAALALILAASSPAADAQEAGRWGFSPYVGVHAPSLRLLRDGEMRSPFEGEATLVDEALGLNVVEPFRFDIPLDARAPGRAVGVRFQWRVGERHALLLGLGTWAQEASATVEGLFPLQGAFEVVRAGRSARLSYNEFFVGWRYELDETDEGARWHLDLSVRELFDISYREEFVFLFLSGPPKSFRRAIVTEARATGALLGQAALGVEWPLGRRFALGLEAGYTVAAGKTSLGEGSVRTDFQATDNLNLELPMIQGEEGRMLYKDPASLAYRPLKLGFDGWKLLLQATIYY